MVKNLISIKSISTIAQTNYCSTLMKNIFTVLMIAFVFVLVGSYLKVNVLDFTGAVSASVNEANVQVQAEEPMVLLRASTLFAIWAVLVLAVTLFFFVRIVQLGA